MVRPTCLVFSGLAFLLMVGCGPSESKEQLTEITGRVLVDGQAAAGVMLVIQPIEREGTIATGMTNDEGMLTVSTYEVGDGLRTGLYQVTFQWGQFDPVSRQYKNDRLAGRYAEASKSEIIWKLAGEKSLDVGEIRLSTQ